MASMDAVGICNVSLANLGADPIRSFDIAGEGTKNSRLCKVHYDFYKDWLLTAYDWSFARQSKVLQQVDRDEHNLYGYSYAIPDDCLKPRNLLPRTRHDKWWLMDGYIMTWLGQGFDLIYTADDRPPESFTATFSMALISVLSGSLCMPVTQNDAWAEKLQAAAVNTAIEQHAIDARIGDDYRFVDDDPLQDTFVDPDQSVAVIPRSTTFIDDGN